MAIYLIRHTAPDIEKGICYGQSNVSLKPTFESEALQIINQLPGCIDTIYTSPLLRCRKLADFIGGHFKVPVLDDQRLMEMNFGEWEMKKWDSIDSPSLRLWMEDYVNVSCPGGESYTGLYARVGDFSRDILQTRKNLAVVTHHGVLKCLYAESLHLTLAQGMALHFAYGSVSEYPVKMPLSQV